MKILSLFDGISCARAALDRAGIPVEAYYASEIDKYAMSISQKNWPDIIQLGSVTDICYGDADTVGIDLLIGGSPCQNLSMAGNGKGLEGDESKLFFEYLRIRDNVKPKYFVLENVGSMSPENKDKITNFIGVEPIMINANIVSAQDRKRLFWIGKLVGDKYEQVKIELPDNKNLFLKDIITGLGLDITERMKKKVEGTLAYKKTWGNIRTLDQKSKTLTSAGQCICNSGATNVLYGDGTYHTLTPVECERLQSLPDNYTEGVSNTQRYKALGNAFNVDVIAHILKNIV